jgi:hypothetical protein
MSILVWEIWRRLENSRVADFVQIGVADCGLGVFEEFCLCRNGFSCVLCSKFWYRVFYCLELYTAILYALWV